MLKDAYKGMRITLTSGKNEGRFTFIEESEGEAAVTVTLRDGMEMGPGDTFIIEGPFDVLEFISDGEKLIRKSDT